ARARARGPGRERAPPKPHHVAGLAGDFPDAADRRGHHAARDLLLPPARDHPVVEAMAWRARGCGRPPSVSAFLETEFLFRLAGIGVLNLLLSGDNALVIALAVRALPKRQRIAGQVWGAAGAVVLRLIFVGVVSLLLKIPFLQVVGGALLIWISVRLVRPEPEAAGEVR